MIKKKQRLIVLFTSDVIYKKLKGWFKRQQICWQDFFLN